MKDILVIEDENRLISHLEPEFKEEGYTVAQIKNTKATVMRVLEKKIYDLIIIDSTNNKNLCNQIKEKYNIPIIVFYNQSEQKPTCNANECIIKPFDKPQLFYTIKKYTLRNTSNIKYIFKDIVLDDNKCEVTFSGHPLELSKREYDVLMLLIKNKNNVLSRDDLLNHVWGIDYLGETNVIDICIKHLRDKFSKYSKAEYIKTIRGIGYTCQD